MGLSLKHTFSAFALAVPLALLSGCGKDTKPKDQTTIIDFCEDNPNRQAYYNNDVTLSGSQQIYGDITFVLTEVATRAATYVKHTQIVFDQEKVKIAVDDFCDGGPIPTWQELSQ